MTRNEINNTYELNLQETHLMRKLDETVEADGSAIIETNFGDVQIIHRQQTFFAVCVNKCLTASNRFSASGAFLHLADKLRGQN